MKPLWGEVGKGPGGVSGEHTQHAPLIRVESQGEEPPSDSLASCFLS